ncbi:MAG: hypothetical protein B6I22_08255 [Desulfobacteraceae bacterium 4572_123]|nr:MAG: hypothetical protein B6I22_08255 [Desulfobacteraceae bacterium 4572_123]
MKKNTRLLLLLSAALIVLFTAITCAPSKKFMTPIKSPVVFSKSAEEIRIEEMHARVFKQLGGYKGPEACYACHQKEYEEVSKSYHVHQGRITKDGKIAHDPKDAVDIGMYNRWYSLSNTERVKTPKKQWQLMEAVYCAQCHPGGGVLKPLGMDVDCLICHQQTGYKGGRGLGKTPAGMDSEGLIVQSNGARTAELMLAGADAGGDLGKLDLSHISAKAMDGVELRVGKPTPDNCNFCHWKSNGKRGTRYGLFKGASTDVHFSEGMRCQECHETEKHQIGKGKIVDNAGSPELRGTMQSCTDCHGEEPHVGDDADDLNMHMERIACETCHIPKTYPGTVGVNWLLGMDMPKMMKLYHWMMPVAKVLGMADPEKMNENMANMIGRYKTKSFSEFRQVYAWYNRETICTEIPHPTGHIDDPDSRITPFNIIATSLFDDGTTPEVVENPDGHTPGYPVPRTFVARAGGKGKKNTTLAQMRAWDNGRYKSAIIRRTPQYFNLYHSIAPAADALKCNDCHTKNQGRLDFAALGYDVDEVEDLTMER